MTDLTIWDVLSDSARKRIERSNAMQGIDERPPELAPFVLALFVFERQVIPDLKHLSELHGTQALPIAFWLDQMLSRSPGRSQPHRVFHTIRIYFLDCHDPGTDVWRSLGRLCKICQMPKPSSSTRARANEWLSAMGWQTNINEVKEMIHTTRSVEKRGIAFLQRLAMSLHPTDGGLGLRPLTEGSDVTRATRDELEGLLVFIPKTSSRLRQAVARSLALWEENNER